MTQKQHTLSIDDMSAIFKALRAQDSSYTLEDALHETLALAKGKGLGATEFSAVLEAAGIEMTPHFQTWLDQKFIGEQ